MRLRARTGHYNLFYQKSALFVVVVVVNIYVCLCVSVVYCKKIFVVRFFFLTYGCISIVVYALLMKIIANRT